MSEESVSPASAAYRDSLTVDSHAAKNSAYVSGGFPDARSMGSEDIR